MNWPSRRGTPKGRCSSHAPRCIPLPCSDPREQRSADNLGVRVEQLEPVGMPVLGLRALLLLVEIGKSDGFKLHVSGKRLVSRGPSGGYRCRCSSRSDHETGSIHLGIASGAVYGIGREAVLLKPRHEPGIFLLIHIVAGRSLVGHPHFHPGRVKDAGRISHGVYSYFS